ncbi:hypothetical protein K525DRAFT_276851 [Schizophyllum commune Loenen D]|nr:hypothetical protein K525DRAFT_276851 [Schizophyllum commune Loenen D]
MSNQLSTSGAQAAGNFVKLDPSPAKYRIDQDDVELTAGAWLVLTDAQRLPMDLRHSNGAHDDSGSEPEDGDDMQVESNNSDDGCDHAVRYARLIAPVVRSARADAARRSRGPPRADGAVFAVLRRSPAELAGPRIRDLVRCPEYVLVDEEVVARCDEIKWTYCGPVDVSHLGELGLAVRDGHLEVAFPPLDANDQVIRYSIPNIQSDIGADHQRICVAGHCLRAQLYDPTRRGQFRWCAGCHTLLHVCCLQAQSIHIAISSYADRLQQWAQAHFAFLLREDRPAEIPPRVDLVWDEDTAIDSDVHDAAGRIPWPATTWIELACLPIRRRTNAGSAPQTIETVVLYAIRQVRAGRGEQAVPDPAFWLRSPEVAGEMARVRAAKYLVTKELRRLRSGTDFRRFLCLKCGRQIV